MLPKTYAFRIATVSDPDPSWQTFVVPKSNNYSVATRKFELNQTNTTLVSPNQFQGILKSGSSVFLTWSNLDNSTKYFTVCYFPVSETKKDCNAKEQLTRYAVFL